MCLSISMRIVFSVGVQLCIILAAVAEDESRSKSFIMNWSIQRRFQNGIFLTPELLGYDKDENGDLVVNESETETVKVIYYLYINGWSTAEIADILTSYRREAKIGNTEWGQSAIYKILDNERHCGDVLAHKTYTPDFKTHKSVKNEGKLPKYRKRDHHVIEEMNTLSSETLAELMEEAEAIMEGWETNGADEFADEYTADITDTDDTIE